MVRGGGWALGGTILSSVLGLIINVLLTRLLPAADVGVYFLLISLVAFCATLAQAGVLQVLLRKVALSPSVGERRGAANDIRSACMYIGIGLFIVGFILLFFFDAWVAKFTPGRSDLNSIVFLIILWTAVLAFQGVVTESFRGFHNIRNAVLFGGIFTNSLFVIMLSVMYFRGLKPSLTDVVELVVGLVAIALVVGLSILSRQIIAVEAGGYLKRIKSIYFEAIPLLLSGLLMLVLSQGDLWIVGLFLGSENTAIYGVAAKLAFLTAMPLNLINAILPPHISQLHAANKLLDLEKLLRVSAGIASIPAFFMALGAVFFGKNLLGFLYGEQFRQAGPVLGALCIGQLCHVALGSSGIVLMLTGRGKTLMKISFFTCLYLVIGGATAASYGVGVMWVGAVAASALVVQKILMCMVVKSGLGIHTCARFDKNFFRILRIFIGK